MGSINFQDFCYNISWLILALAILSLSLPLRCCFGNWTRAPSSGQGPPFWVFFQAQLWVKLALVAVVRLGCVIIYYYRVAHGTVRHIDRWEGKHLSLALVTITLCATLNQEYQNFASSLHQLLYLLALIQLCGVPPVYFSISKEC